jgi:hypothetical protein
MTPLTVDSALSKDQFGTVHVRCIRRPTMDYLLACRATLEYLPHIGPS